MRLSRIILNVAMAVATTMVSFTPERAVAAGTNPAVDLRTAFPPAGATRVCIDTPLRLTFPAPPTLGTGKIQIFDTADGSLVEAVDAAVTTAVKTIGGLTDFNYTPVIITGNSAEIFLKNSVIAYNKTYLVTVDAGAFNVGGAPIPAIERSHRWQFTTKPAAPAAGSKRLTIAADGSGDFCTVQGAIDFLPDGNTVPTTLFVRKGTYRELIFWEAKHAITLVGEDRKQTIITYANNERFNGGGGNPFAGTTPDPTKQPRVRGNIYRRGVLLAHRANDLVLTNLTVRNTTPQGGSQAETIILNGTPTARAILKDLDLYSFQDTLQVNGQAYITNCFIEGDVDFMWGTGPCFFENCTARSVRSNTYYTQIRNRATNHGYVFYRCSFQSAPGVTGNFLSRVAPGRFPHSEVVLVDCVLDAGVNLVAWQLDAVTRDAPIPASPDLHFWEFNSRDPAGKPVDISQRLPASRQLKEPEDAATVANYRNPTFVLGNDWNPKAAAIFQR